MTNSFPPTATSSPLDYPVLPEAEFNRLMAVLALEASLFGWDAFDEDLPEGWDELLVRQPLPMSSGLIQVEGGCLVGKVQV